MIIHTPPVLPVPDQRSDNATDSETQQESTVNSPEHTVQQSADHQINAPRRSTRMKNPIERYGCPLTDY